MILLTIKLSSETINSRRGLRQCHIFNFSFIFALSWKLWWNEHDHSKNGEESQKLTTNTKHYLLQKHNNFFIFCMDVKGQPVFLGIFQAVFSTEIFANESALCCWALSRYVFKHGSSSSLSSESGSVLSLTYTSFCCLLSVRGKWSASFYNL